MIKLTWSIFIPSNNFFYQFLKFLFYLFIYLFIFCAYIKISKTLLPKYCQDNKERLKKGHERYQSLSKEEKNSNNMVTKDKKGLWGSETQMLVEYRKNYYRMKKTRHCNYKKLFLFSFFSGLGQQV